MFVAKKALLVSLILKFLYELKINRGKILKIAAIAAILIFVSFLIEYFVFNTKTNSFSGSRQEETVIENSQLKVENFEQNERWEYVSQGENSSIIIQTGGKYINNLVLHLGGDSAYAINVKYKDPVTLQDVVLTTSIAESMQKNNFNFLDVVAYKIQSSPSEIVIQAHDGEVAISRIVIDNNYRFNVYRFFFILAVISLFAFFILFRKIVGKKPEIAFFVIAMVCGTLISFSELRTYLSWDELIHYKKAENISIKKAFQDRNNIYAKTNYVPASYSLVEQEKIDQFIDNEYVAERKNRKEKYSFFELYNMIAYLPSAGAMLLGRTLNFPVDILFIFGRWINILVFSVIVYFSIKKLKSGKMLMAVIALFPTTLFLASNYGYDYWVIAFSLLGSAYFFSEFQQPEKKIEKKDAAIMLGSFLIGLSPKPIYFPLMFLLFLLPSSKFLNMVQYKKYILICAATTFFVISSFMMPFLIDGPGKGDVRGGELVNSTQQVKFIITEPIAYSKILFNFMKEYASPLNYHGAVVSFAGLGSIAGFYVLLVLLLVTSVTDRNESDKKTYGWKVKLFMLTIYILIVALISSALYVAFTAVRSENIAGVQPRYLIPLIFPLFYVLFNFKFRNFINRNFYNLIIFVLVSIILLYGIWNLIVGNYY
ncbi:MAG: hypothetical protein ACD_9C00151G0004 [uncultured bacterium]|nr:MAG: hypothetical protein ACD_9C00151G0004 [uncultured bacterium]